MKKIKNVMAKMSDEIKQLGKKFPLTMLLIVFVTMLYTITIDQNFSKNTREILEKIYLFCIIWGVGTIFTETYFVKKSNKIISYGITGGISLIFTQILTATMTKSTGQMDAIYRMLFAYSILLILMSIYQSIQKAQLKFEEYVKQVFRDLFNITTTYIILNIGIILVTSIFVELILDGYYGSVMERLFVLLFGLFYVPSMVYTFSGISKREVNSFIKGLILYVLLPLVTIAIAIIYLYIAKILLLRDMPQNTIYRILAGIFIVAFPVWNMASNYAKDKKIVAKMTKLLPGFYAPFILLEIYSIGARIREFGVTPMRYFSCLFIVFQIIVLILTFYKKGEKLTQIFIYASILVLISFVTPLHYENVSNWSQKAILERTIAENTNFEELSTEDKDKVKSAYEYLKYATNGEKWIPSYVSDENKQKIEEYSNVERRNYDAPEYIYLHCELELNVENYAKITYVEGQNEKDKQAIIKLQNIEKTIDLSDKINEIISQNQKKEIDLQEEFKGNNLVKISETEDIYLSRISLSYNKTSKKFNYLDIEGYLLQK